MREGQVSDAVHASAVPGLFRPVLRDGRYLIDGSIVNPIPVSLCRAMGAEVVIAVDLRSKRGRRQEKVARESPSYRPADERVAAAASR
jgi:NTE family protein